MSSSDDEPNKLVRPGWRGDEHKLQVLAAQEAGLPSGQTAVDLYTDGFKQGIVERDPGDGAIVLRGRTILKTEELEQRLAPMFKFLRVASDAVRTRVHDGEFEVRVAGQAAEASAAVQGAARSVLLMWIAGGLLGWWMLGVSRVATFLVWGITLIVGAWSLRRGLVSGRTMLAARLAVGLALLAHEEQLILPPGGSSGGSV